ncbi:hypothetical protein [Novosphingobium sp. JCM 18896]|uniref:hypothetical protein n=1 Tax=Novosphingobium sp. JCM 18896 TaxID=2989731 RepID=UPI002221A34B|nr:hypothetical protein [Novosphingobium sp. JCM 18896]MCW1430545.1 hypothetical protein [Novosphingobium sp. JCM 18896]
MTKTAKRTSGRFARRAALPALLLAPVALITVAQAQTPGSVQDFQLPAARPSPTATAAGPVDSEHPTAEATRPAPEAAAPVTTPPTIVVPPATTAPTREATSPRAIERPSPGVGAGIELRRPPAGSATPTPAPPGVERPEITTVPLPAPSASAPAVESPAPAESATVATGSTPWPWIAGGAVLALLAGAWFYRHRSARPAEAEDFEEPQVPSEASAAAPARPEPSPPAVLPRPQELNKAPPPPAPEPAPPAIAAGPLEMEFEARHLSRAMVNAALAYRLTLTNRADTETGPLRLAGDIVSAHASLSAEEQLLPVDAALATLHEATNLAPGESISLAGELRMPIASILPIHRGGARVFVPLARFRAEAGNGTVAMRVFVVGQASEQPGGALKPFPLDRGPGVDRGLGQRELGVPV